MCLCVSFGAEKVSAEIPVVHEVLVVGLGSKASKPYLLVSPRAH